MNHYEKRNYTYEYVSLDAVFNHIVCLGKSLKSDDLSIQALEKKDIESFLSLRFFLCLLDILSDLT